MNNNGEAKPNLSYGEASDLFQRSFPGGSADQDWLYLGGTTFRLSNLKLSKNNEVVSRKNKCVIPTVIVKFPNESQGETDTEVFDEQENLLYNVTLEPAEQRQFLTKVFDNIYKGYKSGNQSI